MRVGWGRDCADGSWWREIEATRGAIPESIFTEAEAAGGVERWWDLA